MIDSLDEADLIPVVTALVDRIDRESHDHPTVDQIAESITRCLLRHQWPCGGWPCDFKPRSGPYNPNCQFNDDAMLSAMRSLQLLHRIMPAVDASLTDDIEDALLRAWQFVAVCYENAARPGLPPVVNSLGYGAAHRPTEPGNVIDLLATHKMRLHADQVAASDLPESIRTLASAASAKFTGLLGNAQAQMDLTGIPGDGNMARYMLNDKNYTAWFYEPKSETYGWRWSL